MPSLATQRTAVLIIVYAALIGVWIAFSPYYEGVNADAIVTYMHSLLRWTPFMWGQDRYGMLIPALTSGIANPLYNVIAQNALHIFTSVVCFFLLARFLFAGRLW